MASTAVLMLVLMGNNTSARVSTESDRCFDGGGGLMLDLVFVKTEIIHPRFVVCGPVG